MQQQLLLLALALVLLSASLFRITPSCNSQ
jgi:hypothetical protein